MLTKISLWDKIICFPFHVGVDDADCDFRGWRFREFPENNNLKFLFYPKKWGNEKEILNPHCLIKHIKMADILETFMTFLAFDRAVLYQVWNVFIKSFDKFSRKSFLQMKIVQLFLWVLLSYSDDVFYDIDEELCKN